MSPEKAARLVSNQLMGVFRELNQFDTSEDLGFDAHSIRISPLEDRYLFRLKQLDAIDRAARKLVPFIDSYPIEDCVSMLSDFLLEEKDARSLLAEVHSNLQKRILNFISTFDSQGEWEVAQACRGIDIDRVDGPVGPCEFYEMDKERFRLWGQRYSSGNYNPPVTTNVCHSWPQGEQAMMGQVVGVVRVNATTQKHALAKASFRLQETIDLLRYAQLTVEYPTNPFPEIGVGGPRWHNHHSFAMRVDAPGFASNKAMGGAVGCSVLSCRQAPAWTTLEDILKLGPSERSEMQIRAVTALQWIGQAALAPSSSSHIVALVTALEALLIDVSESAGKRRKLSNRVARLTTNSANDFQVVSTKTDELYRLRSECVHAGLNEVEKAECANAIRTIARTFETLFAKVPFSAEATLAGVLAHISLVRRGDIDDGNKEMWVSENAYHRYLNAQNGSVDSTNHWHDAEREYIVDDILRGQPLISFVSNKKSNSDESEA